MRYLFKELPGDAGARLRPVVPVVIEGVELSPLFCLVDSGSLHNRFAHWAADMCGIDLTNASEEVIGLGGFRSVARTVPASLTVGGTTWTAPVSFCDPWPLGFQVLGQEGFFRWFKVGIRAARFTIDLEPEDR